MRASLVRKVFYLSFSWNRESRIFFISWIPARARIAGLAGMTTLSFSEPDTRLQTDFRRSPKV
jgi:hypothetical protein